MVGRRGIQTRLAGRITIREENAIAALEIMSRFAADPRWLIYLPPTMSPCKTSKRDDYLENPTEAFEYYRELGVSTVVCEEKHMGSRAVAVVCRDAQAARDRFATEGDEIGAITTRTGRRFFDDLELEQALLGRMRDAASQVFDELNSDWLLIDLELMPWSAKAQGLLKDQYARVGASASASAQFLAKTVAHLSSDDEASLFHDAQSRLETSQKFIDAYRRYCWPVQSIDDYKLAPFHLLASEGKVHIDKDHVWHMTTLARICDGDPAILRKTPFRVVKVDDEAEVQAACAWWEDLTNSGGEGMVVKPLDYVAGEARSGVQPAMKCRGREYLRIIYGPEYLLPANLERLKSRGLKRKQALAWREFALGIESIEKFVRRDALRNVHECVFGILALESEPVDPRL